MPDSTIFVFCNADLPICINLTRGHCGSQKVIGYLGWGMAFYVCFHLLSLFLAN